MQNFKKFKAQSIKEIPTRIIYTRLSASLINRVKAEANKIGIPYKSLMVQYIAAGVAKIKKKY